MHAVYAVPQDQNPKDLCNIMECFLFLHKFCILLNFLSQPGKLIMMQHKKQSSILLLFFPNIFSSSDPFPSTFIIAWSQ